MLSALGVELALTTNGVRLPDVARALKQAGLHRITVSLDALDEAAFQRICDAPGFRVSDVLQGIEAAERAGFEKLKINCVVQRGQNEDQVEKLFSHFKDTPHELRFIEFMDVGTKNAWASDAVVTKQEILTLLRAHGEVVTLPRERPEQVAEKFRIVGQADASGRGGDPPGTCEVGVISSVSEPFCGDCSRARLSADGQLFSCLFASSGVSLRTLLRSSSSASEVLTAEVRRRWEAREDRYSEARAEEALKPRGRELPVLRERVEMSFIGG